MALLVALVVEARQDLGEAVDDVVGARLVEPRVGTLAPPLEFLGSPHCFRAPAVSPSMNCCWNTK